MLARAIPVDNVAEEISHEKPPPVRANPAFIAVCKKSPDHGTGG
jgi:hypothetical protein